MAHHGGRRRPSSSAGDYFRYSLRPRAHAFEWAMRLWRRVRASALCGSLQRKRVGASVAGGARVGQGSRVQTLAFQGLARVWRAQGCALPGADSTCAWRLKAGLVGLRCLRCRWALVCANLAWRPHRRPSALMSGASDAAGHALLFRLGQAPHHTARSPHGSNILSGGPFLTTDSRGSPVVARLENIQLTTRRHG